MVESGDYTVLLGIVASTYSELIVVLGRIQYMIVGVLRDPLFASTAFFFWNARHGIK